LDGSMARRMKSAFGADWKRMLARKQGLNPNQIRSGNDPVINRPSFPPPVRQAKTASTNALEKYAVKKKLTEKLAFVVSWGGRRKDYGKGKVQGSVGYSNLFGVVPFPAVGLRLGDRKGWGMLLTTSGLGLSNRAQSSFENRPWLKGLSDILLEKLEKKENR